MGDDAKRKLCFCSSIMQLNIGFGGCGSVKIHATEKWLQYKQIYKGLHKSSV